MPHGEPMKRRTQQWLYLGLGAPSPLNGPHRGEGEGRSSRGAGPMPGPRGWLEPIG